MKRRLFNVAAAVTLVIGVAMVPLWVRSYRCADHVALIAAHTYLSISFCRGQLHVELGGTAASSDVIWNTREPQYVLLAGLPEPSIDLFGFDFLHAVSNDWGHFNFWIIGMPYWFVMLLLGVLPVTWLRKRRQVLAGCCLNCGYDLRALV